jgi:hypothetical protein
MRQHFSILIAGVILCIAPHLQAQTGTWISYTKATSGLPSDTISAITFDGSGAVWIGTPTEGLAKFNGAWTIFNDYSKVPSNNISALSYANGNVWIGSNYGLTKTDGSTWSTFTMANSGLADDGVWGIAEDENRNLWLATGNGLNKYTAGGSWSTFNDANLPMFPANHLQLVTPDMQGHVWTSFYSAYGMMQFNVANPAASKLITSDSITNFPADHIMAIAVDWGGKVWAGTEYRGLIETDGNTATVYAKSTDPNWISDNTRALAVDQCGHVWVGTDRGAARFDGTWTVHTKGIAQLPNDTVNTITVDASGHVWFGTNGGVEEFKPYPEKPWLSYPANASTIAKDSVTCSWAWDCPGILKYWHEIADNPQFTNSHIDTTSNSLTQSASKWDTILVDHATYYWRVKAENDAGWGPFSNVWTFTVNKAAGVAMESPVPSCTLSQSYPNPTDGRAMITFSVSNYQNVSIKLYDMLGRECATLFSGQATAGNHTITVDPALLPHAGVYVYRLVAGNDVLQHTMQVVR